MENAGSSLSGTIAIDGTTATLGAVIRVSTTGDGRAALDSAINSFSEVLELMPHPGRIDVGESTHLDLTAVDAKDNPLGFYGWVIATGCSTTSASKTRFPSRAS